MSKVLGGLKVTHITLAYANTNAVLSHVGLRHFYLSLLNRVGNQAHLDASHFPNFSPELDYLD